VTASGTRPADTAKEKPQRGTVLASVPVARTTAATFVPLEVAEGDTVIFSKYGGTK